MENKFREITIPGDVLEDDRISDGAKIIYGKISRLSHKDGYCWASNAFLDGTRTGRNASRFIAELRDTGYICIANDSGKNRKIFLRHIDSRVNNLAKSGDDDGDNLAKSGDPTSPELATPLAKSGEVSSPNLATEHPNNSLNKQKKETDKQEPVSSDLPVQENPRPPNQPPEDKPIETKEDGAALFQKSRLFWNERGLKPECRDLIMRCSDTPEILRTFQHYSWAEIRNAIGNYHWHKTKAGPGYSDPPPYGSLAGFLKTGVERYFDDDALDQQFLKERE